MSSPWGKIDKIENTNFVDIMSEEYARGLQDRENKKYSHQVAEDIMKTSENCCPDDIQSDITSEKTKSIISDNVYKIIKNDTEKSGIKVNEVCDSDAIIAQVVQAQFDYEYNHEIKLIEKQKNKDSKVSISFDNYKRYNDENYQEDEDYYEDAGNDKNKDWDRFETNERKYNAIPKCGFKVDKELNMIVTKHDAQICGIRNACRIMSLPLEFSTGDSAGFDMKLSNSVYNDLKTYSHKTKKNKMYDKKEYIATAEMGVDERSRLILYKLINKQVFEQINGIISTGKEALILHAYHDPNYVGDLTIPKECAIKIFKTTLNEFKQRDRYIKDDYRFKERFNKQNNRVIINMWAEKEMLNMIRMKKIGINCPDMILLRKHILVMSFIGNNNKAAPKLKDAKLNDAELSIAYEEIIEMMHKLYNKAKLIHADLSEYNILWHNDKCWFIDLAQSVEPRHPHALEFLMRDCTNIINFFQRRGLPNIYTKNELFEYITALKPDSYDADILESIHNYGITDKNTTIPKLNEITDEILTDPFELAWEKSIKDKNKIEKETCILPTEALKVLNI